MCIILFSNPVMLWASVTRTSFTAVYTPLYSTLSSLEPLSSLSDGEWLLVPAFSFDVLIASTEQDKIADF